MSAFKRGIAPDLLVSQIKNTMPYLFEADCPSDLLAFFPAQIARDFLAKPSQELTHFEYYRLCVSAHYLTCATPVPTDVDIQIRQKLWAPGLPIETALEMATLVLQSQHWDFTVVSRRYTRGASGTAFAQVAITGHQGEWFTMAAGAYCALKKYSATAVVAKRQELFEAMLAEIDRHSEVFGSHWRAGDGIPALKTAASISHNFGDLDRVMDMWNLELQDPLRLKYYKLTQTPFDPDGKLRYLGRLWVAGQIYKEVIGGTSMAFENHRHLALRKPKALRAHPDLMIQTGPFLEDWGRRVGRYDFGEEALREVVEALVYGWSRLPKTIGYGRALRGILEVRPEAMQFTGVKELYKDHHSRVALEIADAALLAKWNTEALRLLDEIPSRA